MKKSLDKLTFIAPKRNIGRQPVIYIGISASKIKEQALLKARKREL